MPSASRTRSPQAVAAPPPATVAPGSDRPSVTNLASLRHQVIDSARRLATHWALLLPLLVAAFLRFKDLGSGFLHGDDAEYGTVVSYLVQNLLFLGYPDLQNIGPSPFVSQPPVMLYIFALVAKLLGDVESAMLLTNATLGIATVLVVYLIGLRVAGKTAGAIASTFLAVQPMHVDFSRSGFLDVGMTFFMALSILFFLHWEQRRSTLWAVLTGSVVAVTILTKLPGLLVLGPLLAALVWIGIRTTISYRFGHVGPQRPVPWRLWEHQGVLAAAPILFATTMYVALLWYLNATKDLMNKVGWNAGRVTSGTSTSSHPWHWYFSNPGFSLPSQLGIAVAILALVGIVLVLREAVVGAVRRAGLICLVAFPIAVGGFFILSARKQEFYILPLMPILAILAAVPVAAGFAYLYRTRAVNHEQKFRRERHYITTAFVVLVALLAMPPAHTSYIDSVHSQKSFGYGIKEAALVIEEIDPEGGQFASLLGRYTSHFYNGNPTFDVFSDRTLIEQRAQRGEIRFVIFDDYLDRPAEQALMLDLVAKFNGTPLAEYVGDDSRLHVILYELDPEPSNAAVPR